MTTMPRFVCSFTAMAALLALDGLPALAQPAVADAARARAVTLALSEYDRLVDLAARANGSASPAPVVAGAAAVIDAQTDGVTARGTIAVAGTTLRAGPMRVPLVAATTAVDAPASAPAVPLVVEGDVLSAIITTAGPFALTLEWRADVRTDAGRAALTLPAPRTGTARAVVRLPGEPGELRVSHGTVVTRRRDDAATVLDLALVPGAAAEISWIAHEVAPLLPAGPARVVSEVGSVVTLTDSDVRVAALITLDVSRGRLPACTLRVPAGYRIAGVHGATVERVDATAEGLRVTLLTPDAPRHVLLAELERAWDGGAAVEAATVSVVDAQRERGDLAVESAGTSVVTESTATGADRVDVQEMGPAVRVLARWPLLAGYRYQRGAEAASPRVVLGVARFADAVVAPAIVSAASATTLLTTDGRALTEVRLHLENARQPFAKVDLPAGGRIVSVSLDDEPAKPVAGADGVRLPLLHADGGAPARELRYTYLQDGAPFARKGQRAMRLPAMDLPIGVVQWEVFVPDGIRARRVEGTALDASRFVDIRHPAPVMPSWSHDVAVPAAPPRIRIAALPGAPDGQVRLRVTDAGGAVIPGVSLTVRSGSYAAEMVSNERGDATASGVPPGRVLVQAALAGFTTGVVSFDFDRQAVTLDIPLSIGGALQETVTVTAQSPTIDASATTTPPDHVLELQQRVAGVLPLRVDVPRAGRSLQFTAALVVDEPPTLTLAYKRR